MKQPFKNLIPNHGMSLVLSWCGMVSLIFKGTVRCPCKGVKEHDSVDPLTVAVARSHSTSTVAKLL